MKTNDANEKIRGHLDEVFGPHENSAVIRELKEELMADLQERYSDFIKDGIHPDEAFEKTIKSLGDISELVESISDKTREIHRRVNVDFSMSDMKDSKLDAVDLKSGKFNYSNIAIFSVKFTFMRMPQTVFNGFFFKL